MKEVKIPNKKERFCINCSRIDKDHIIHEETLQKPIAIKIYSSNRGCFSSIRKDFEWKWECLECGEVDF